MITLVALVLSGLTSFAQPRPLGPDEKVTPLALLEFEDEPGHFIFVGRSGHQHNTFDIKNGVVTEWLMKDGRAGGLDFDLRLEGPARLVMPEDHPAVARRQAYVSYPDRAREPLARRPFDRAQLIVLGLGHVLEDERPEPSPRERAAYEFLPEDGVMVLVNSRVHADFRDTLKDDLKTLVAQLEPGCWIDDGNRLYSGRALVVCAPHRVADFVAAAEAAGTTHVFVARDGAALFTKTPFTTAGAARLLKDHNVSLLGHFGALRHLARHAEEWDKNFDAGDFADLPYDVLVGLRGLEQITQALLLKLEMDVRVAKKMTWGHGGREIAAAVHAHPLYRRLIAPLNAAYAEILAGLAEVDRPAARRLVLIGATGAEGAGLPLLSKPLDPATPHRTFADAYLDWQMEHVRELTAAPAWRDATTPKDWRETARSGGVFEHLNLSAHLTGPYLRTDERSKNLFFENERVAFAPAVELGQIADHRALKKKIVNFVIAADQLAGRELPRLNDGQDFERFAGPFAYDQSPEVWALLRKYWEDGNLSDEELARIPVPEFYKSGSTAEILASMRRSSRDPSPYTGSLIVSDLLRSLLWPPAHVFDLQPNYRHDTYFANVVDIVTTLLEDGEEVLATEGTYLQLIDMALHLQRESAADVKLRDKQRDLGRVVQARLLRPLYKAQGKSGCEFLLSPDPFGRRSKR